MRRGLLVVAGLMAACVALPASQPTQARDRGLIGAFTSPLDALFGGRHYDRHRHSRRHRTATRRRSRTVVTTTTTTTTPAAEVQQSSQTVPPVIPGQTAVAVPLPPKPPAVSAGATVPVAPTAATRGTELAPAASSPPSSEKSEQTLNRAAFAPPTATAPASAPARAKTEPAAADPAEPAKPPTVPQTTALAVPTAPVQRNTAGEHAPEAGPPQQRETPRPEAWPLGVVGPLAWPSAFEDVVGFTLWPQRYGQRLHVHGIVDVLAAMFEPKSAMAARGQLARASGTSDAGGSAPCGGTASDWPAAEIARSLTLTGRQQAALDQLKASIGNAVAAVKASCTDTSSMPPVERLQAMEKVLWAVRDATVAIRAPLAAFYEQLTDEQKSQFVTTAPSPDARAGRDAATRMCGMSKLDVPMRQAERSLHPNGAQRASFDNLQKKSFEMSQFLLASCLQPIPTTPTARVDAASDRLTAVIFATSHISIALNDFYNQLSPDQQARFNAFGR